MNDVDVIDLHAKIEMKGTTRTGVEWSGGEKGHSESTIAQRTKREQVRAVRGGTEGTPMYAIQFKGTEIARSMDGCGYPSRPCSHQIESSNK